MANAALYTFHLDRGSTWERTVTWREPSPDPNDPLAGPAIDMTNWIATFVIQNPITNQPVFTKTPTIDASAGKITLALSSTETATLLEGFYEYELRLDTLVEDITLLRGQIKVDGI